MNRIAEKDWKTLRSLKDQKLSAACDKIFQRVEAIAKNRGDKTHQAYLKLWKVLNQADQEIVAMFDDLRRSTAIVKLAHWRKYGILSDDELSRFTTETQATIRSLSENGVNR